jgi:aryl-alcohol dehydrogenase-like predicted oxidoreductase
VLCGARDPQQAIENAAAGQIALSAQEAETMSRLVHT